MSKQEDNSKVIDFEKSKKDKELEEDLRRQAREEISKNLCLQKVITILSGNPLYNKEENDEIVEPTYDYNALLEDYKAEAVKNNAKFVSLGEPDESAINYYYDLFQTGYRSFGADFFLRWVNGENNNLFFIGIWGLVRGIERAYGTLNEVENELRAYKSLELTNEQKEKLAKELEKTPEEYLEELISAANKSEKE